VHAAVFALVVTLAALTAAACAKARAQTEPELPTLSPPPPPPRIIETYADEPLPTVEPSPAETALATPPARPPARPRAARPETAKPEPPRLEPERSDAPPLTLKLAPAVEARTEASIRSLIGQAGRDLQRVNYAALDRDGRAQYDAARRFMEQAEEALKNGNLPFAGKLADKAATMAGVLVR
jgi:hypothetical protein